LVAAISKLAWLMTLLKQLNGQFGIVSFINSSIRKITKTQGRKEKKKNLINLKYFYMGHCFLGFQMCHKHGRPQTFFQGRAKFSRGGKNILFWSAKGGGGQVPPLALPCGRPW